jgi:glucose uptake protein
MTTLFWSICTVIAWGAWLAPLQASGEADERWKTLWICTSILLISTLVAAFQGFEGLEHALFWPAVAGGCVWAWSGLAAVKAVQRLGMARAMGIWSPLNILVSLIWGALLFGEFEGWRLPRFLPLLLAVLLLLWGIWLIASTRGQESAVSGSIRGGLLAAVLAGIGWGSYFLPLRWSGVSPWVAAFPLSVGMMLGNLPVFLPRKTVAGKIRGLPVALLAALAGGMWALGNYGSLFMMEGLGTGRGFTVAQSCVVVNALIGVFLFRTPAPGTGAARKILAGIAWATLGAVGVGSLS